PLIIGATVLMYLNSRRLNVLSLGRDAAISLGVNHKFNAIYTLVLVSILMATTTALVGPMTFLGFLVATLAYQFADTYDHRYLFHMASVSGSSLLTCAYFNMTHACYDQYVLTIVIELVGGSMFLYINLRKGRL